MSCQWSPSLIGPCERCKGDDCAKCGRLIDHAAKVRCGHDNFSRHQRMTKAERAAWHERERRTRAGSGA